MPGLYYYVCAVCGSFADIAAAPHQASDTWACADCDSLNLMELTNKERAISISEHTREVYFTKLRIGPGGA